MIIFDEFHHCLTPTSAQSRGLQKLNDFKYKVAMTGTPVMNAPLDVYVALKWLGVENANFSTFRTSPTATLYCFPPVSIIANILHSPFFKSHYWGGKLCTLNPFYVAYATIIPKIAHKVKVFYTNFLMNVSLCISHLPNFFKFSICSFVP